MKEINLFSFPHKASSAKFPLKKQELSSIHTRFKDMNPVFIERSVQDFANSILSDELYKELRPKVAKKTGNLIHI